MTTVTPNEAPTHSALQENQPFDFARQSIKAFMILMVSGIVLADFLFFGHLIGWTLGLFLIYLAVTLIYRKRLKPQSRAEALVMGLLLLLFLTPLIEPGPLNIFLSFFGLATLSMFRRPGWTTDITQWLERWIIFTCLFWVTPFLDSALITKWRKSRREETDWSSKIVRLFWRWALAIGMGGVFVVMFGIANPIIQGWIDGAMMFLEDFDYFPQEVVNPVRVLFWGFIGWMIWSLHRFPFTPLKMKFVPNHSANTNFKSDVNLVAQLLEKFANPEALVRALLVFNLIFGIQTAMDLFFLWGGGALPEGMTYAQYAHRGAYPLVVTALLAAAFVLLVFRPHRSSETTALAKKLVLVWLIQNIALIVSAGYRLNIYVEIFTLTRLRVAAAIWMGIVATGLGLIFWRILRDKSNSWLIGANAIVCLAVLYVCCFINFDRFIARYNVEQAVMVDEERAPIDFEYLQILGPDSLPALDWLIEHEGGQVTPQVREKAREVKAKHIATLKHQTSNWRGWTLRRKLLLRSP